MKSFQLAIFTIIVGLMISSDALAQEVILYGVDRDVCGGSSGAGNSTLVIIDPSDGSTDVIGPVGFQGLTALEFLADGRLVGSGRDDGEDRRAILVEINPDTGQGSLIGLIGDDVTTCGRVPGMTFDPSSNTLYGTGDNCDLNDSLFTINQQTGFGTIIGEIGGSGGGNGLARSPGGIFYAVNSGQLFILDPQTGTSESPGFIENESNINSMDFHPLTGELYGIAGGDGESNPMLVIIDPETRELTEIGSVPQCLDGIVFSSIENRVVPTLSQWGLIATAAALGIIALLAVRRRNLT